MKSFNILMVFLLSLAFSKTFAFPFKLGDIFKRPTENQHDTVNELNKIEELKLKYPDATPLQILKLGFEESNDPISVNDLYNEKVIKNCASLGTTLDENKITVELQATNLFIFKSRRLLSPEIPAEPSRGPLFPAKPGIPAKYAEKIVPTLYLGKTPPYFDLDRYDSDFDKFSNEFTDQELLITFVNPKVAKVTYQIRKSGKLLFVKSSKYLHHDVKGEESSVGYTYCWPEEN